MLVFVGDNNATKQSAFSIVLQYKYKELLTQLIS